MRLPRLSEPVIRRSPSLAGAANGGVHPASCNHPVQPCTSDANCTDANCPYCVNGVCEATRLPAARRGT